MITGGTSGIGATFARQLAARGENLVLVARDRDRLEAYAEELRQAYGIEVQTFIADLAQRDQVQWVIDRLEDPEHPIDTLVNNAGFGLHSNLLSRDTANDERAFDVMIKAVFLLGGAAARAMKARGHGKIICTASAAGFITMGNYSAIKAYVTTYAESLATQLHGTGVTVTALEPGWVKTEFHERAGINQASIPSVAWIDGEQLVREAIRDADAGRVLSIPTPQWKLALTVAKFLPRATLRWVSSKLISKRD